jgi:dUTP pyrophosphatase
MQVSVINKSKNQLPQYETPGAAGLDIRADLSKYGNIRGNNFIYDEKLLCVELFPGGRVLIPTGLFFELPVGYHLDIRPRSGLALKQGITVLNTPGLLDEDYRGELGILLINHSNINQIINNGDRIAQIVMMKSEPIDWIEALNLTETSRDSKGFGTTGRN